MGVSVIMSPFRVLLNLILQGFMAFYGHALDIVGFKAVTYNFHSALSSH